MGACEDGVGKGKEAEPWAKASQQQEKGKEAAVIAHPLPEVCGKEYKVGDGGGGAVLRHLKQAHGLSDQDKEPEDGKQVNRRRRPSLPALARRLRRRSAWLGSRALH